MRVTQQMMSRVFNFNTGQSLQRLLTAQQELTTGRRISKPSDSIVDSGVALRLEQSIADIDRFQGVISGALTRLSATDSALGSVYQKLIEAHGVAVSQIDGTANEDTRTASAQVVGDILSSILSTAANHQVEGRYIFSGSRTQTSPFLLASGGVEYLGDEVSLLGNVAAGSTLATNLTGQEAFGALSTEVKGTVDLNPGVTLGAGTVPPTRLADLRQGLGVASGSIAITVGATTTTVDLSGAEDLKDVENIIENAVSGLTVTVNGSGNGLLLTHGSSAFSVAEVGGGTTASNLGISGSSVGLTLTGTDENPLLTRFTPVSSLNGTGLTLTNIAVTNGTLGPVTIDLSAATTMQDVLNTINQAKTTSGEPLRLEATINSAGTGINIRSRLSGTFLKITEGTGTSAASLGVLTKMTSTTPLYTINNGAGFKNGFISIAYSAGTAEVNLTNVKTVGDVMTAISSATGGVVTMSVASAGDRFTLTDSGGGANPTLNAVDGVTTTITSLGFTAATAGAAGVLNGSGVSPLGIRAENLFTALVDLRDGLTANDVDKIERAMELLDAAAKDLNAVRGGLGGRVQRLESLETTHDGDRLDLTKLLSEKVDVDAIEAASRLAQEQTAYQAALQVTATVARLSLLNYL